MTPDWQLAAELSDTARASKWNREQRHCLYCGRLTRAVSGVCLAHSDLPRVDPVLNVQAGRFTKRTALGEAQTDEGKAPAEAGQQSTPERVRVSPNTVGVTQ